MKKIYMLSPATRSAVPKFVCATNSSGRALLGGDQPESPPSSAFVDLDSENDLLDGLLTAGNELIFSDAAATVLRKCNLDPALRDCAVQIKINNRLTNSVPYRLWYSVHTHAILHESAYVRKVKGHLLSVYEWVADESLLPPYDLFLGPTNRWFATERLVDQVYSSKLKGFAFYVVPCA